MCSAFSRISSTRRTSRRSSQSRPDKVRAELLAQGADLERVRLSLYRALGEEAPPAAKVSSAPATVTPIAKARPDRVLTILRSISVAVAARFFGPFVWRERTMRVAPDRPARPELSDSREAPPPSMMAETDAQKAVGLCTEAYRLCDQGHWGPCEDKLDEAARLDRIGNQTLEVNEARNRDRHGQVRRRQRCGEYLREAVGWTGRGAAAENAPSVMGPWRPAAEGTRASRRTWWRCMSDSATTTDSSDLTVTTCFMATLENGSLN